MNDLKKIMAGLSYEWTDAGGDYPASDGYTLYYVLLNASGKITFNSTASGADHVISLSATSTSSWTAGTYNWYSYASDGTNKYPVAEGTIEIIANVITSSTLDGRSHAKKALDAIEAAIERRASKEQLNISIAGRSIQYMTMEELIKARSHYLWLVKQEENKKKIDAGLEVGGKILVRF